MTRDTRQDVNYPEPKGQCMTRDATFCFHERREAWAVGPVESMGGFLPRSFLLRFGIPDRQCVGRALGANAVVGEDFICCSKNCRAREDDGFARTTVEFNSDKFILRIPQDLDQ